MKALLLTLLASLTLFGQQPAPVTNLTVTVGGVPLTGITSLTISGGAGVVLGCVPSPCAVSATGALTVQVSANTASIQSVDNAEQAGDNYCKSSNGTTGFTCKLQNKALAAYKEGMPLKLFADVPCTTTQNCSVNIDSQGIKTLKDSTGQNGANFPAGFHVFNLDPSGVFRMAY